MSIFNLCFGSKVGGLNTFIQTFLSEVYAIVRCHVSALKGNALVGYFMSEFAVEHSLHKNQVTTKPILAYDDF